jgi:hypothetical protein
MSVPTAQFEGLDLTGGMPPHTRSMSGASASTGVQERAIIIRDIFSSFTPDCLPSEYKPDVYNDIINNPIKPDDPATHARPGDLVGSLFRW